jgi:hypothetical protein
LAHSRLKSKGRRESGPFVPVPYSVLHSDNWKKLSAKGSRLLLDVLSQINMKEGGPVNNGDLAITRSMMKHSGWTSAECLYLARDELIHYGFLTQTRPGGRNFPSLYAVTFFAINDCDGKHLEPPTTVPPNTWKESKKKWKRPRRKIKTLSRFLVNVVPLAGTTQ